MQCTCCSALIDAPSPLCPVLVFFTGFTLCSAVMQRDGGQLGKTQMLLFLPHQISRQKGHVHICRLLALRLQVPKLTPPAQLHSQRGC